jgi:hypothetical protein
MTTDEVFNIAADAGLRSAVLLRHYKNQDALTDSELDELDNILEFARQIAAVEREACAKVCEETEVVQTTSYCMPLHDEGAETLRNAAADIRARHIQERKNNE